MICFGLQKMYKKRSLYPRKKEETGSAFLAVAVFISPGVLYDRESITLLALSASSLTTKSTVVPPVTVTDFSSLGTSVGT